MVLAASLDLRPLRPGPFGQRRDVTVSDSQTDWGLKLVRGRRGIQRRTERVKPPQPGPPREPQVGAEASDGLEAQRAGSKAQAFKSGKDSKRGRFNTESEKSSLGSWVDEMQLRKQVVKDMQKKEDLAHNFVCLQQKVHKQDELFEQLGIACSICRQGSQHC